MRSRVKTGDVIQIRKNGPNYIALGKVRDSEGNEFLAATRNGNITVGGAFKEGTGANKPKVHIIEGGDVKRVHGHRTVDMASVVRRNRRLSSHLTRTDGRDGIPTDAPNIQVMAAELAAGI